MKKISMNMKVLSEQERYYFYHSYLAKDFHESEVKSFALIEELILQGNYLCIGFFQDTEPYGYAYFAKSDQAQILLLDYFAVVQPHRSEGFGSAFLKDINNYFCGNYCMLVAEAENPAFAMEESGRTISNRRIEFYLRNGFKTSNVVSRVLTDEYQILTLDLGKELPDDLLLLELQHIYPTLFGEAFTKKNIYVRKSAD